MERPCNVMAAGRAAQLAIDRDRRAALEGALRGIKTLAVDRFSRVGSDDCPQASSLPLAVSDSQGTLQDDRCVNGSLHQNRER